MFTKQYTSLKVILYSVLMIFCYLLQSVPSLGLRFMGNAPELLLVLTVAVAYFESTAFSAFFGLFAGLLNDIITDNIVGKSALFFMFAAFFISLLLQTLLRDFFLTYIFISLGTLTVFLMLEYLLNLAFYGDIAFGTALIKIIIPKLLFSGVIAYPVYFVLKLMNDKLWPGGDETL